MKLIVFILSIVFAGFFLPLAAFSDDKKNEHYIFPDESEVHEGTWLQWPHSYTYGINYQKKLIPIWIKITEELSQGENVHIVVYDEYEKKRIISLLKERNVNMDKIDFYIHKTDDVWARDSGPVFVWNKSKELKILDYGFNGWGEKVPFNKDKKLRQKIARDLNIEIIDLNDLVIEGGSIEFDGNKTMLATKSSIVNKNRNPHLSEKEIENILSDFLGIENFIWLDGVAGIDITDFHIDGFAKFYSQKSIITMNKKDLEDWGLSNSDIKKLYSAKNLYQKPYDFIYLPLTSRNVVLKNGKKLGYKGSYVNYYIGNKVVLIPFYNDENDKAAAKILEKLYPERKIVGIDVRDLYENGGMIHCITQQQPGG